MDTETTNVTNWAERIDAQSHSILNKIGIKTSDNKDEETRQNSGKI